MYAASSTYHNCGNHILICRPWNYLFLAWLTGHQENLQRTQGSSRTWRTALGSVFHFCTRLCFQRVYCSQVTAHSRSVPALLQAKNSSWNSELEEGKTGTTELLFIEFPETDMMGIEPKLRRSALQSCLGLCTKLPGVFEHDSASNGVVVSHH